MNEDEYIKTPKHLRLALSFAKIRIEAALDAVQRSEDQSIYAPTYTGTARALLNVGRAMNAIVNVSQVHQDHAKHARDHHDTDPDGAAACPRCAQLMRPTEELRPGGIRGENE